MFQKILIAFDDSKESTKALDQAILLVKENPAAALEVIHVFHLPVFVIGDAIVTASASVDTDVYANAQQIIAKAEQRVSAFPNVKVTLKQGEPSATIVKYAEETRCDLIIVGSRGLSGLKEVFIGSVSHHIIQHSKVPVLVVK